MYAAVYISVFFFFNDTATTEIYTLSLHDALPICPGEGPTERGQPLEQEGNDAVQDDAGRVETPDPRLGEEDTQRGVELRHRRPARRDRPGLQRVRPVDDLPAARPGEVPPGQDREGAGAHRERHLRDLRKVRG